MTVDRGLSFSAPHPVAMEGQERVSVRWRGDIVGWLARWESGDPPMREHGWWFDSNSALARSIFCYPWPPGHQTLASAKTKIRERAAAHNLV